MAFSPFDANLGTRQGRIQPTGFTPTTGDFAFVLGSDTPGHFHRMELGDNVGVEQLVDLTAENFVRMAMRMRAPTSMPAGFQWEASLLVGGTKRSSMIVEPSRVRDRIDLAANVSKDTGSHLVRIQLELVAV